MHHFGLAARHSILGALGEAFFEQLAAWRSIRRLISPSSTLALLERLRPGQADGGNALCFVTKWYRSGWCVDGDGPVLQIVAKIVARCGFLLFVVLEIWRYDLSN
jgi:hypothetical protein